MTTNRFVVVTRNLTILARFGKAFWICIVITFNLVLSLWLSSRTQSFATTDLVPILNRDEVVEKNCHIIRLYPCQKPFDHTFKSKLSSYICQNHSMRRLKKIFFISSITTTMQEFLFYSQLFFTRKNCFAYLSLQGKWVCTQSFYEIYCEFQEFVDTEKKYQLKKSQILPRWHKKNIPDISCTALVGFVFNISDDHHILVDVHS